MDELRIRHLGAQPKRRHDPRPLEHLDAAYVAAQES